MFRILPLVVLFYLLVPATEVAAQGTCTAADNNLRKEIEKVENYFYKTGNYTQSTQQLHALMDQNPTVSDLYDALINIAIETDNDHLIVEAANLSVRACPLNSALAHYELGQSAMRKHLWDAALVEFAQYNKSGDTDTIRIKSAEYAVQRASAVKYLLSHPVPFDPKPVNNICSSGDEYLAVLSPDQELVFFTRKFEKNSKDMLTPKLVEEFSVSIKEKDGSYSRGEKLPYPFNTNLNEGGPSVTVDNNNLYFTVCKSSAKDINCDIYYSNYDEISKNWSAIKPLAAPLNLENAWDSQPSISADGQTLYFASNRPGGYGGSDIYRCKQLSDGRWGEPQNLGPKINSAGNEKSPFIHTDSQTLYFSSDSLLGMGGYDIYFTHFSKAENQWSEPKNIGYPINTEANELGFFVSTDGKKGYFASTQLGGQGGYDIFSFDLYQQARPKEVIFIKGKVNMEGEDAKLEIPIVELKNLKDNSIQKVNIDKATGKFVVVAQNDANYSINVKKEGFVNDTKLIKKLEVKQSPFVNLDFTIEPIAVGRTYKLKNINFQLNSFQLADTIKSQLDGLIVFLSDNPKVKISINGHTDNINDDKSNLLLSESRAKEVYNFLIEKGISADRLSYKGFGETKPIASNETELGRAQNRRTEFVILEK